jgi:hypothetical protein
MTRTPSMSCWKASISMNELGLVAVGVTAHKARNGHDLIVDASTDMGAITRISTSCTSGLMLPGSWP